MSIDEDAARRKGATKELCHLLRFIQDRLDQLNTDNDNWQKIRDIKVELINIEDRLDTIRSSM